MNLALNKFTCATTANPGATWDRPDIQVLQMLPQGFPVFLSPRFAHVYLNLTMKKQNINIESLRQEPRALRNCDLLSMKENSEIDTPINTKELMDA